MIKLISVAALMVVAACSGREETPPAPALETARTTAQGKVVGFVAENGAHVWRGIPFAASTAGKNRWRAPRPATPWEGVREALIFAERCAQFTNRFDEDEGLKPGLAIGSEDCLALDIYAPAGRTDNALPVMVWIHGGANVWGRSSSYDGSHLAENEDLVVVAVQYRLGPFGWFSHEALRASAQVPEDAAASFATLDLIASLKWVRDNIAEFGGDPDNVTIFGESAGGHNVVTLLASSLAEGLFHRAIVQSGSFDSVSVAEAEGSKGELVNPSNEIAEKLNATTAEALRAVSVKKLLAAYGFSSGFLEVPTVIEDGIALPASPLRGALASTETFNAVPIITGTNRDEMKLFYFGDDMMTKRILGFFIAARDQDFYDAVSEYTSRVWRIRSVDEPAALMTKAGHEAVYTYRFDWDDGGKFMFMDFKKGLGAAHGFEIPFVFNRFQLLGSADSLLFQKRTRDDREVLSRAMGGYWASFARDGAPSYEGAPQWPVYGENSASFLRFDTENDGGIGVGNGADDFDLLVADLLSDPRVDNAERCLIAREMGEWLTARPILKQVQAATGCE